MAELNAEGQRKAILATTRPIIYYDKYKVLIKFGTGNYGFRYYREAVKAGKKVVAWQDLEPLPAPELELQTDDHGYQKSSFEEVDDCPELLVSEKYSKEKPGLVTWIVLDMYFD